MNQIVEHATMKSPMKEVSVVLAAFPHNSSSLGRTPHLLSVSPIAIRPNK